MPLQHVRELGTLFVDWRMPHAACCMRRSSAPIRLIAAHLLLSFVLQPSWPLSD
jgi:hypothetical protein